MSIASLAMKQSEFIPFLVLPLILLQVAFAEPSLPPIVNVHESVASVAEIVKLQEVNKSVGVVHTVLQAIPEDLLNFAGDDLSLSEVEENNAALKQVIDAYPQEFSYFCSIDPVDPSRTEALTECLNEGALGVKMYNGYSYAHLTALDDARLNDFYTALEEAGAILMLPVNTTSYEEELRNMLTLHPDLTVICPHYCLSSKSLTRLTNLMNDFQNLYVDTSFGNVEFAMEGFETISSNADGFKEFFTAFQDRILFGTDAVLTSDEEKTIEWATELYQGYVEVLQNLDLPYSVFRKVLYQNWTTLTDR